MRFQTLFTFTLISLAVSTVHAQHTGDVVLTIENSAIVTAAVQSGGGPIVPTRVWAAEFGALAPNFTDDPGFDAPAGTFNPNAAVGIAIRKALRKWNPASQHFDEIPTERLQITRSSLTIQTPLQDPQPRESLPSLQLGLASSGGVIHVHPWYTLTAPHGMGVYLLELEAWVSTTGIDRSEPFWIVFNQNDTEQNHDEAIAWAVKNLADSPGTPTCAGDLNGDNTIDVLDLLILLGAWGNNPGHPADMNGDGTVDVLDLLILLGAWGECP
ncbi:MAG TPA: dockerin type I domain-containing protein [Phycisphaerales bacterium]|nr:dockerin type I domain-containing protein [Phycisphaerales bacterium]HRQ75040.1 dockerin type I domain-containing protein [Phycisphaerales bacterium]